MRTLQKIVIFRDTYKNGLYRVELFFDIMKNLKVEVFWTKSYIIGLRELKICGIDNIDITRFKKHYDTDTNSIKFILKSGLYERNK